MQKIGITTFYNAYNYGAFLQTFALQKILEKKYDVSIIEYSCEKIKKDYKLIKTTNMKKIVKSLLFLPQNIKRTKKFKKCINDNIKLTNIDCDFDCVIAGSDQIWNINLTGGYDKIYSLEYFKNMKRISYASSIGDESLVHKNQEQYTKIMNNIDKISVREESAKKVLEQITSKNIKVTLDPTLLLTKEEWDQYVTDDKINEPYIFSYFVAVTQENYDALKLFSKKFGLKTLSYSENPKEYNILKKCFTDDPFEFITKIKNAEMVFVSSFHATVFSIIFNKQFYCMPPKDKKNRIVNLLEKLDLTDRIIDSKEDIKNMKMDNKIEYKSVNKKLESLRKDSLKWLQEALEE